MREWWPAPQGPYESDSVLFGLRARFGTFWAFFRGRSEPVQGSASSFASALRRFSGGSELFIIQFHYAV